MEGNTEYVDGAYDGSSGPSNGSPTQPWTTITDAITAAEPGAIVAVAAGNYAENLQISHKPVRLWGRCPSQVEVIGIDSEDRAIDIIEDTASGTEIHQLAITGNHWGIGSSGAQEVVIDRVWIHDVVGWGLGLQDSLGSTQTTLTNSLIELSQEGGGVALAGSNITIEAVVVRDNLPGSDGTYGRGIIARTGFTTNEKSNVTLRHTLVERNHSAGISIYGSNATIEAIVVRDNLPNDNGSYGRGINVMYGSAAGKRSTVTLKSSLIERNHEIGLFVAGADVTGEAVIVRDNKPDGNGEAGRGINLQDYPGTDEYAHLTLRASLIERNHGFGIFALGSNAIIETVIVRDNKPNSSGEAGMGIYAISDLPNRKKSTLTLSHSLIERNHEFGLFVTSSDATLEGVVVCDTKPNNDGTFGRGISVQPYLTSIERSSVTIRTSIIERNHDAGLYVMGSDATINSVIVRDTWQDDNGEFGSGMSLQSSAYTGERSRIELSASLVERNHENGLIIDGSDVNIEGIVVRDTQPNGNGSGGRGISVQPESIFNERSVITIKNSLLEHNHDIGLLIAGSDAIIETVVVRDTWPDDNGNSGRGIGVQPPIFSNKGPYSNSRSSVTLRTSLIESNHDGGLLIGGSDATIEGVVVRNTRSDSNGQFGRGIGIQDAPHTGEPSNVMLTNSLIEQNQEGGLLIRGSEATIEGIVVRDTKFDGNGQFGRGIDVAYSPSVLFKNILIERNHETGLFIIGSNATVEGVVVRDTQPNGSGHFGDGIAIFSEEALATAIIHDTLIESSARAGLSNWGAEVTLGNAKINCSSFHINGETFLEQDAKFSSAGGNLCGCQEESKPWQECAVQSAGLEPPPRVEPLDPPGFGN